MKYYVFRLYTQTDGTDKSATTVYTDKTQALKYYYKLLAADIDDESKTFVLCAIMDENGKIVARQRFDHAVEVTDDTSEEAVAE